MEFFTRRGMFGKNLAFHMKLPQEAYWISQYQIAMYSWPNKYIYSLKSKGKDNTIRQILCKFPNIFLTDQRDFSLTE